MRRTDLDGTKRHSADVEGSELHAIESETIAADAGNTVPPDAPAIAIRVPSSSTDLAPGLYLVATPIGNLEDITLRALRILRSADLIACEDTRQTQKLLHHYGITNKTLSYHQHNEGSRTRDLLAQLEQGARIALVSDAGMPGISDPGSVVVKAAIRANVSVFPVPGPSAALSALTASGFDTEAFIFCGFLPARSGERRTRLEQLRDHAPTLIFYEAPHRILESLADISAVFGPGRLLVLARELTKVHEEFLRGTVGEVRGAISTRERIRGEIVLVVEGASGDAHSDTASGETSAAQRVRELMAEGYIEKDALKQASRELGLSKSHVYRELQREKHS